MKNNKIVYILMHRLEYESSSIEAVFSSLKALRDYVAINFAEYKLDEDGDYEHDGKWGTEFLEIFKEELRENGTDQKYRKIQ